MYNFSFLCKVTTSGYGEPPERHSSAEKCPSRNACLDTFPWRVNWPELEFPTKKKKKKTQAFYSTDLPETPEAIAAIKLI